MQLVQVAKEEEAVGIAAGAYFAGTPHILLMQNHGFFGAINGIVSLAELYHIPLCMLIAYRGHWGEPYPWHTRGGIVTEGVLRALGIPFEYARDPQNGRQADPRGVDLLAELPLSGRAAAHARPDGGLMERAGCLEMIYPELHDKPVVTIMGACAQELYNLGHRENFFYLQHAMGLASSIGLGLAMHLPARTRDRARRRRLGADEPRHLRDARALPSEEPHARRLRQRQPPVHRRVRFADDRRA